MNPTGDFLRADAERIVAEAAGKKVTHLEIGDIGVMTPKYFVESPVGNHYVARFYPPKRKSVVDYELDIIQCCREVGMFRK